MQALQKIKETKAFSLVELMVVVAIIGILATIAVPKFKVFQAKARQAEAKTTLAHIYTLEQAYFGDNDTYINMPAIGGAACANTANAIGFYLDNCAKTRYTYTVAGASTTAFTGSAATGAGALNKVSPGCPAEVWTINATKVMGVTGDVTRCNL